MVPPGSVSGEITMGLPTRIVVVNGTDSGGVAESVALIVTLEPVVLAVVGAPVICPEVGLIASPGGSPVAVQVYGPVPPVTVSVVAT
jgi:hypothetical protein